MPGDALAHLLAGYAHEHIAQDDVIGAQRLADALAIERHYLTELGTIPREPLDASGQLSYELFRRRREQAIEGFTYPEELMPLKPVDSMPFRLAAAAAASGQRTLGTADYVAWLSALDACSDWLAQAQTNLREGLSRGYTEPRPLIEHLLIALEPLGRDQPDNPFYTPLKVMADSVPAGDRERVSRAYTVGLTQHLLPALRTLHDFLAKDYLPKARTSLSITALPLGSTWYAYRLKRATGLDTPAADLHQLGLSEMERLKGRGLPAAPTARPAAQLLADYQLLQDSVAPKLAALFESADPPPALPIAALELPLETASAVSYQPAHPPLAATLYVHAAGASGRYSPADFLAVALPGAYWRDVLLQRGVLPAVRREATPLAYVRGWDMYAASLGEPLGVYGDDTSRGSWTLRQLQCAAGLVLDTGIHAKGWTRDKALDYLRAQTMIDPADGAALIDEIVASPGNAAACELGFLKFQQLRARAQQALGARFEDKEFHTQLLSAGVLPLDVLESRVKAWWEASR